MEKLKIHIIHPKDFVKFVSVQTVSIVTYLVHKYSILNENVESIKTSSFKKYFFIFLIARIILVVSLDIVLFFWASFNEKECHIHESSTILQQTNQHMSKCEIEDYQPKKKQRILLFTTTTTNAFGFLYIMFNSIVYSLHLLTIQAIIHIYRSLAQQNLKHNHIRM